MQFDFAAARVVDFENFAGAAIEMQAVHRGVLVKDDGDGTFRIGALGLAGKIGRAKSVQGFSFFCERRIDGGPSESVVGDEFFGDAEDARLARLVEVQATGVVARLDTERKDVESSLLCIDESFVGSVAEAELAASALGV